MARCLDQIREDCSKELVLGMGKVSQRMRGQSSGKCVRN